jgi:Domain of unknown function (DUF397)
MRMLCNGMPASCLTEVTWVAPGHGEGVRAGAEDAGAEMAALPSGSIAMRNSRDPGGPALIYTHAEIEAFIGGAKEGEFDHLIV